MSLALRFPVPGRVLAVGLLAASVVAFPGAVGRAATAPTELPAYRVVPGTVLHPRPPTAVLPVAGYRLTGRFADQSHHWASGHTGLDFAAPTGTPIRSIAAGRVVEAAYDGSYGLRTIVRLADGTELWYCHQDASRVRVGDRVRGGERIGSVGSSGNVTGPHLHLEVRPGQDPVDPLRWLRVQGVRA